MTTASKADGDPSLASSPPGPRTKLEFIYAEVLGEVTRLLEKLEAVAG